MLPDRRNALTSSLQIFARSIKPPFPKPSPQILTRNNNKTLNHHMRNARFSDARLLFDAMPHRDLVSWNTMISGYARAGLPDEARDIFDRMPVRDRISWKGLLAAYLHGGLVEAARRLFDSHPRWDAVSCNAMIAGFLRKRRLGDARALFDRMTDRDVVSWNTMVSGYARSGSMDEARRLFEDAPLRDVYTWTALVSGYARDGAMEEARGLFDHMPERNAVSWNAMIFGYARCGMMGEAVALFEAMPCRNTGSWNTMVVGYARNGDVVHARRVFDEMPQRDSISWSTMIGVYSQYGMGEEALRLFIEMGRDGAGIVRSIFNCVLSTCADMVALECGRQVHGRLVKAGFETGCFVGNTLMVMYSKCGSIDEAYKAFEGIMDKDVITWNTMITGYARHGFGKEALDVFASLLKTEIKPDDITLVGVLSACSHTGLVNKGISYFYSMHQDYGMTAKPAHYTCMIDLLGRAGRLKDAEDLLRNSPYEPDATMWGALLGASRIHGNTKLGEAAAERIFEMEPKNSGMYVLLSNLYASEGRWADVGKMRVTMRERDLWKVPGYSWIELQNAVHIFSVGDSVHPDRERIYAYIEELDLRMKAAGYVSATKMVLHDVEEEEKEHVLKYHSEKLAVAFGLLNVPPGKPIRVIKNLRVCKDCHSAIKYISALEGRLIILRDSNRFHHFKDGSCSCGDYW